MSVSRWRQVICPDLCLRLPRFPRQGAILAVIALFFAHHHSSSIKKLGGLWCLSLSCSEEREVLGGQDAGSFIRTSGRGERIYIYCKFLCCRVLKALCSHRLSKNSSFQLQPCCFQLLLFVVAVVESTVLAGIQPL